MLGAEFKLSVTIILHSHKHFRTEDCGTTYKRSYTVNNGNTRFSSAFQMSQFAGTARAQNGNRESTAV